MTGLGYCGPMTAMGTVFEAKTEGAAPAGQSPRPSRYRSSYRVTDIVRGFLAVFGG